MNSSHSNIASLALKLVEIPSVTGDELAVLAFLQDLAHTNGMVCQRVAVEGQRYNLLIRHPDQEPRILFSTHVDTVPGGPASALRDGILHGRGSCDAKGIAAAMWFAFLDLLSQGHRHTGLLFVIGEETCSDGAKAAARALAPVDFIINGEPTDLKFVAAQRGVVAGRISVKGRAAHSGYPELGHSAVHALLDILTEVRGHAWPSDEEVGPTLINVGVIAGGSAPNVLAESAHADVMVRVATKSEAIIHTIKEKIGEKGSLEVRSSSDPQFLAVPEGEPSCVVGFGSDVAHLRPLGALLMMGPGSIHHAHTDHEHVAVADLETAAKKYCEVALKLANFTKKG